MFGITPVIGFAGNPRGSSDGRKDCDSDLFFSTIEAVDGGGEGRPGDGRFTCCFVKEGDAGGFGGRGCKPGEGRGDGARDVGFALGSTVRLLGLTSVPSA
jgi:hypothetical protein